LFVLFAFGSRTNRGRILRLRSIALHIRIGETASRSVVGFIVVPFLVNFHE